jgi:hypothetical protein
MARARRQGKPSGRSGGHKEAIVFIPLTYNDGTRIPPDTIESISDEIFEVFDGWTGEGTVKGAYRMQTGEKRVEKLLKVSIVLAESQILKLEEMVADWCARLGQETMLLKITDSVVKFIPPRTKGESS